MSFDFAKSKTRLKISWTFSKKPTLTSKTKNLIIKSTSVW